MMYLFPSILITCYSIITIIIIVAAYANFTICNILISSYYIDDFNDDWNSDWVMKGDDEVNEISTSLANRFFNVRCVLNLL